MDETVGGRIKRLRQIKFKAQREVAVALGISVPAYSKIETGNTELTIPRLRQIADYFGVSVEDLLNGEGHRLISEMEVLRGKLKEVSDYCIVLQRKLIATYEMLDELKRKYNEDGMIDLARHKVKAG